MANHKLQITDEERRIRRAEQLRKGSYRCPVCSFCFQAKPNEIIMCGKCCKALIDAARALADAQEGAQIEMGVYLYDLPPLMVESAAKVTNAA
jgi:hypothetical protein